jgi:DNA-binding NtrC family response regulator
MTGKTTMAGVLLIEDEDDVREPNAAALERAGHRVIPAASWTEAIELSGRPHPPIDVILTDLVMPDDAGVDDFSRLRDRHGDVPVIVFSAHPAAMRLLEGVLEGVVAWLQKPQDVTNVVAAVERVLESRDV